MPTPLTHAFIPLALGHTLTDRKLPLRFWFLVVFCSVLPDLDVIGFSLGVSYGDFWGHRGFSHSLFFAFLLSSMVMLLAFRKPPMFSKKWWSIWLFFFGVSSSHGILDAFTNGGLGIALLSPFNTTRYFSPWRPFVVAPIGIRAFFTPLGKEVLLSELYWIWLPLILAFIIAKLYRKTKHMNYNKTSKAEHQVELAKNVFKRLFLTLLVLLLIAGLVFQAPWKIIILLLALLLACTVLPKSYRKWFWLGVGLIVIALITWVFLPDDNEGWQPYKYNFDEELTALEAKYAIPDSENAATIYSKLFQDYDEDTFYANLPEDKQHNLPMREPWLSKDHPELAEWLQHHKDTIEELIEASKIERRMFRIHDPENFEKHIDRNAALRRWAYLLVSAANNDIVEGHIKQGFRKNIALLQMGKHLSRQPTTIDWLVGIAIESIAISQFQTFAVTEDTSEEYFSFIEQALISTEHDWSSDFLKMLESDKLSTKREFSRYYEINTKGKIRLSRDLSAQMRICCQQKIQDEKIEEEWLKDLLESVAYPSYLQRKLIKADTIFKWFYIPSNPQKAVEIIDASYERLYAMAEPDFDWQKEPKKFSLTSAKLNFRFMTEMLVSIIEPAYYRVHDMYLRLMADRRGSRIIIALRRYKNKHGTWPQSLDEIRPHVLPEALIDPFNDGPFIYRLTDSGFQLYSTGKNKLDENAKYRDPFDDWPIWPPRIRKPKPEQKNANTQPPDPNANQRE